MAKLFVFGIGGTGTRIIKSLAMLLASGVDTGKQIDHIIPIIIDVDKGNNDLTRTVDILRNYETIYNLVTGQRANYKGFFQTMLTNLFKEAGDEYRMRIMDVKGKKFGEYIDFDTLDDKNKDLADLLFSGYQNDNGTPVHLLQMDMAIGFQGNPKLGCVVLNQFKGNPDFNTFASNFIKGDRIFIISSIHGGTGAAGFPLLLKNLRNADLPTPNSDLLKNAIIGAATILPYFHLKDGDIKSSDFISKTKAALQYYIKNVNPSLNSMYYIGNSSNTHNYENHKGGKLQRNDAHFIELAAAMSLIDFARRKDSSLSSTGNRFLEFGVQDFSNSIDFSVFGNKSREMVQNPMIRYHFFKTYIDQQLGSSLSRQPWSNRGSKKITSDLINSPEGFFKALRAFNVHYGEWLNEMGENDPRFVPFNNKASLLHTVTNKAPGKRPFNFWKPDFVLFDDYLNAAERKVGDLSREQKFLELFNIATNRLLTERYK